MSDFPSAERQNPFVQGPILPALIRFALPLMLSLLLQALYGGVDLAVVGRFSPTASAAAVATGSQVMHCATVLITGLTMGVTVCLGKAIGARDRDGAAAVVAGQIRLFALVAVVLTVVMILFAPQAARWMHVPQEALEETVRYLRICSSGMVFITAYNGISGIFRGMGNSRSPFLFVLIACVVNVVLDLLFVAVFHMAASGAALATVIAQAVSVAFSAAYLRRHPLPFALTRDCFAQKGTVSHILKVGAPIALQDFLVNLSFLIITSIVNTLGLAASAGIGVSEKLFSFLAIVPMAFMSALSAFVAQNMGAGQPQRARQALRNAQGISFAFGVATFLLTFLAGDVLASWFDQDPAVITATQQYLKSSGFEYLITPLTFCFLGYFNGREHTGFVMFQGLFSAFLVRVPASYLLSRLPGAGMFTIGLAVPVSALCSILFCLLFFLYLQRKEPPVCGPGAG